MISSIISVLFMATLSIPALFYLVKRYHIAGVGGICEAVKRKRILSAITSGVALLLICVVSIYFASHTMERLPLILKWCALLVGLYLLAIIDYKERKIPNQIILCLLALRIAFLIFEYLANPEYHKQVLLYPLFGLLIGGGTMLAAILISRKGIGMGDVKMMLTIGLFVGSTEILSALFYIFLSASLVGVVLLLTKKVQWKDSLPMAPFAFTGVLSKFLLLAFGG